MIRPAGFLLGVVTVAYVFLGAPRAPHVDFRLTLGVVLGSIVAHAHAVTPMGGSPHWTEDRRYMLAEGLNLALALFSATMVFWATLGFRHWQEHDVYR